MRFAATRHRYPRARCLQAIPPPKGSPHRPGQCLRQIPQPHAARGRDERDLHGDVPSQLHDALQYWSSAVNDAKMFQLKYIHFLPGNLLAHVDAHSALHVHLRMLSDDANLGVQALPRAKVEFPLLMRAFGVPNWQDLIRDFAQILSIY